ncbi:hypothetical protein [uncultured Anaerococcus sp.]|uniref:hypothetical protein n=1 Tax=uncultured Anaerococcus sp. TaxID=293428 RepID=UPI0025FE7E6A|nr:hypothetical protein [uncultured Anaerococcus sp.]
MRSILKFLGLSIITILIPALFMGLATIFNAGEIIVLIAQMFVILVFVFIFTNILKYQRKYEAETEKLLLDTRDIQKLKDLREKRKTYKSKASITSKILNQDNSQNEVDNLLKYATSNEDMEHYYSAKIDQADKNKREEIRRKRDDFANRYGKKQFIFPDFDGNLKTSIKWIVFFFVSAFLYNFLPPKIFNNDISMASFLLLGMLFLAVVMVNTILWIVRTLKSYWMKDYL